MKLLSQYYRIFFGFQNGPAKITGFLKWCISSAVCSQSNSVPKNIVTKNHSLKLFFFKLSVNAGYPKEKRKFLIHAYLKKTFFSMPIRNSEGVQVI